MTKQSMKMLTVLWPVGIQETAVKIQVRYDGNLGHDVSVRGDGKWLDSGYNLRVEKTRFDNGL